MTRDDGSQRPANDRYWFGFRFRRLDLVNRGATFLRRRGIEHARLGGLLVHRLDAPDPGLDMHDHPWPFVSIVLRGGYFEEFDAVPLDRDQWWPRPGRVQSRRHRRWSVHKMPLRVSHRIAAVEPGTVTLVVRGRKVRDWGFYQPDRGWVDWREYDYEVRRPVDAEGNRSHDQDYRRGAR